MNILVIRVCAIGDFVLNLPALTALQECHPAAAFTLVGNKSTLEIAQDFITVAAVHSIEGEPWRRLFYEEVDGLRFDKSVVWMKDPIVAENLRRSGLSDVLAAPPFPETGHAAAHLLHTLGLRMPELPDRWQPKSDRILLHPGSGSPRKSWPYFRELAGELKNVEFVIGPAEADFDTGEFPRCEKKSLREIARELTGVRGYIGNDSGITHFAGYLGCPTIAIFGPTDPEVWGPLGRRVRILRNPQVDDVRRLVEHWGASS